VKRSLLLFLAVWLTTATVARAQTPAETLVRETPDRARDSIAAALRAALRPTADTAARAAALRLSHVYATVWGDRFPEDRVGWALALAPDARRRLLEGDSLRRAGNAQLFRDGPTPALATWRRAAQRFAEIGDSVGVAQIAGNLGAGFYELGALDSAAAYLERAGRVAHQHGDLRTAGNAATILGNIAWERGDLRSAIQHNLRAVELHGATANFGGVAADHNNAGLIAEELGDLESARRHYTTALQISERRAGGKRTADYLVNLGGLAAREADLETARRHFLRALGLYREAGESVNEALIHRNLGTLAAGVSAYDTAVAEYTRAITLSRQVGDVRSEVEVHRLLASVYTGMGRVDEALEEIGAAETQLGVVPDADLAAAVGVVRGDIELMLNRYGDAAASYSEAERRYRSVGDVTGLTAAALGRAQLQLRRQRYGDVIRLLESLEPVERSIRDVGWTQLLLGVAHAELGDSARARTALTDARAEFDRAGDRTGAALALGSLAELKARYGRVQGAQALFREALELAAAQPAVRWWLHLGMGRALERAGDAPRAAMHYDSAVTLVESLADWVRFDDRRAMYLEDKWEPYAAMAQLRAQSGDAPAALVASERLRARSLLDLLARRRSVTVQEGALRAQERRLSERIGELTAQLVADDGGRRGPPLTGNANEVREELLATQGAYRRLLDRMRAEEPDYVRALRGETVSVSAVQGALESGDLLLEYLLTDDRLWIFAATDTAVTQLSVAVGRATLRTQIDFARWALEQRADQETLWRGALRGLDDLLLDPVRQAGLLDGRSRVIIVPHRELHYLPFEALIDRRDGSDHYFVESHDVAYVPSASVWLRMRERSSSAAEGVLALAPLDTRLRGTAREVEAIHQVWGSRATVRRGAAATEASLRRAGDKYRIVHLATRGILNRYNPLFSYVELGPSPETDGRLEVHEVLRLTLAADLLVLSACQTGLGSGAVADVPNGDDWVGLVRAFMRAGARNVLATLWEVDDVRMGDVAAAFHRRVAAGASYVHALAEAKREAIRHGDMDNPFYWAGLILTGTP
jgi:CHAT domain-containing protein